MTTELAGPVEVITGGASGIGAATATLLADRGAAVAILDRDTTAVDNRFTSVNCDITSTIAVDDAVTRIVHTLGAIDIVVNNADIGATGDVSDNGDDEWHRVFDVNVMDRTSQPRRTPPPETVLPCGDRQRVIGHRNRWCAAGALYSASKGAWSGTDPGNGRRSPAGRHPGQRGCPRNH